MRSLANICSLGTKELRSFLRDYVLLPLVAYSFSLAIIAQSQSSSQGAHNASVAIVCVCVCVALVALIKVNPGLGAGAILARHDESLMVDRDQCVGVACVIT